MDFRRIVLGPAAAPPPLAKILSTKGETRDVHHRFYEQRCGLLWKKGPRLTDSYRVSPDGKQLTVTSRYENSALSQPLSYWSIYGMVDSKGASAYLKVKPRTLAQWVKQQKVPGHKLSGTRRCVWRFLQSELDAMLTSSTNDGEGRKKGNDHGSSHRRRT